MRIRLAAALSLGLMLPVSAGWADGPSELPDHVVVTERPSRPVLEVELDFAHVLLLEEPAATIAIGNSGIVEASLSDDQTVILSAQAPGTTNLIILDEDGAELTNTVVQVVASGAYLTTVYRGADRYTYSCSDRCTPVVSVGDEPGFFDNSVTQIETRQGAAGSAE